MALFTLDEPPMRERRMLHWTSDAAVVLLLFGPMMNAWVIVVIAAAMLVGLLAYAFLTDDPARHWIATRAIVAGLIAGALALAVVLIR